MKKDRNIKMSHLHTHSVFSELDAISKLEPLVKRAKEYGHDSVALVDHGTIAGLPSFYKECKKQSIKPILGMEAYFVPSYEKLKENKDRKKGHLILLAINEEGWLNLRKLVTVSNEQFYYSPTIDFKDLVRYGNGIIA